EFGGRERVRHRGREDVSLSAGVAREAIALAPEYHDVLWPCRESVLSNVLVEHTGLDASHKSRRRRDEEIGLRETPRKRTAEPEPPGEDTLARLADAHLEHLSDSTQRLAEQVEA